MNAPTLEHDDDEPPADQTPEDAQTADLALIAKAALFRKANDSILKRYHSGELIEKPKTQTELRDLAHRLIVAARDFKPFNADNDNDPNAPINVINPSEWAGIEPPVREWFIPNLIPAGTVTLLSGDGGVGKSLLKLQIGVASALGRETLGLSPRPGGVMYVGAEDDEDEFHRRIADICRSMSADIRDLDDFELIPLANRDALLSVPEKDGSMRPTDLWRQIRERALIFGPGLVVFDTSADLFGGDEIRRSQVRQFIGMLRRLAIETGAAVVLLSHPSVAGIQTGSGTSGSTAWSNSVRSRLYLTKAAGSGADPDVRVLTVMKANYSAAGDGIRMRWSDGAFIEDDCQTREPPKIVTSRHDSMFISLLAGINRSGRRVAQTKGVNFAPKILASEPGAVCVTVEDLEQAMLRLLKAGEIKTISDGPPSKPRQKLIVSAEDFSPAGRVAI